MKPPIISLVATTLAAITLALPSCDPISAAIAKQKQQEIVDSFNMVNAQIDSLLKSHQTHHDSVMHELDSIMKELHKTDSPQPSPTQH